MQLINFVHIYFYLYIAIAIHRSCYYTSEYSTRHTATIKIQLYSYTCSGGFRKGLGGCSPRTWHLRIYKRIDVHVVILANSVIFVHA